MSLAKRRAVLVCVAIAAVWALGTATVTAESASPSAPPSPAVSASPTAVPGTIGTVPEWGDFVQKGGATVLTLVLAVVVIICVYLAVFGGLDQRRKFQLVAAVIGLVVLTVVLSFVQTRQQTNIEAEKVKLEYANKAQELQNQYDQRLQNCQTTLANVRTATEEKLAHIENVEAARGFATLIISMMDRASLCNAPLPSSSPSSSPGSAAPSPSASSSASTP